MALGTYGRITTTEATHSTRQNPIYQARARYRDADGVTRPVLRTGATKGRAEAALKLALTQRQAATQAAAITPDTTVARLAELWFNAEHDWSIGTRQNYAYAKNNLTPVIGSIRIRELTIPIIKTALERIRDERGAGAAKSARSVLANMCKHAVDYGALQGNPLREIDAPSRKGSKKAIRALTRDEVAELHDKLRSDRGAVAQDLPDLVDWMLGTGCRIGEALACRYMTNPDGLPLIDITAGTWEINATALRMDRVGVLVQEKTKSEAGWRIIALPPSLLTLLERRRTEPRLTPATVQAWRDKELRTVTDPGIVFPSPDGHLRDGSNTQRALREVLDRLGFDWVTSHVFRKTVVTDLLNAGLPPQQVSDQVGHRKPSMTLDYYAGRHVVSAEAARILER